MKKRLGHIATINFGLHKRGKLKGGVKYLQASHFDEENQPTRFQDSFVELTEKEEKFLLQPNDMILTGKGNRLFAWAYSPEMGKVSPSSVFYILQLDPNIILNQYLAYYLNSERMQHQLLTIGAGATIMSIPKKELQEIKILVPPLEQQQKIIEVLSTVEKSIDLTNQLLMQQKQLKKGILNQMLNNITKLEKT